MNNNLRAFSLSQNINCEDVCKTIQNLIDQYKQSSIDVSDCVLVIRIQKTSNYNKQLYLRLGDKYE